MTKRSDIAFSPAVKQAQSQRGSRAIYERAIDRQDWPAEISEELRAFIAARDSLYLGTASGDGQPYIQHRGGPPGFIKVLDSRRLAIADYAGNRQYISVGNLSENDRAFIFLIDYPNRRRVKLWGRAEFVEGDETLTARVTDPDYRARVERVLVFTVEAWDINCPQHIRPRYTGEELESIAVRQPGRAVR